MLGQNVFRISPIALSHHSSTATAAVESDATEFHVRVGNCCKTITPYGVPRGVSFPLSRFNSRRSS